MPHSPFGMIFQIASQGVWTWKEVLYKVPWCVVLASINDQPRHKSKKEQDNTNDEITSEKAAKDFFGL